MRSKHSHKSLFTTFTLLALCGTARAALYVPATTDFTLSGGVSIQGTSDGQGDYSNGPGMHLTADNGNSSVNTNAIFNPDHIILAYDATASGLTPASLPANVTGIHAMNQVFLDFKVDAPGDYRLTWELGTQSFGTRVNSPTNQFTFGIYQGDQLASAAADGTPNLTSYNVTTGFVDFSAIPDTYYEIEATQQLSERPGNYPHGGTYSSVYGILNIAPAPIPEPSTAGLLAIASVILTRRSRAEAVHTRVPVA